MGTAGKIIENPAPRYVDLMTDSGFKAVFGEPRNKRVLIDLLNIVLPPERTVSDIEYSTTELPGLTFTNKNVRLDLRCTDSGGRQFVVEMQSYRQEYFFRRCVEYAAKVYDSGSARGDGQRYEIPPVYFVGILGTGVNGFDRSGPEWTGRYISEYTLREKITGEVPDETIFTIFVELDRFTKSWEECEGLVEQWCYAFKNVGRMDGPPEGLHVESIARLLDACEIARFSPEKKLKYESDMMTERDYYNIIDTARHEGEAKGFAEGEAKGEAKAIATIARAMLASGMPIDQVSSVTGLSLEKLRTL